MGVGVDVHTSVGRCKMKAACMSVLDHCMLAACTAGIQYSAQEYVFADCCTKHQISESNVVDTLENWAIAQLDAKDS